MRAQSLRVAIQLLPLAFQAISLGYFSLGQQRKVTRASAEARNARRAGEPTGDNVLRTRSHWMTSFAVVKRLQPSLE